MEALSVAFEERLEEIDSYLEFLEGVEVDVGSGQARLNREGFSITPQQQRILYAGVYLQLYNLVEGTVARCLDGITEAALEMDSWAPGDLTKELRGEWVRVMAGTHKDLNYGHRLENALGLCDHLLESLPVGTFKIERGGGGNWDDSDIKAISSRLGLQLRVSSKIYENVKRPFRDELGALALIKKIRNSLAHGDISFSECGANLTVKNLRDLTKIAADYLREVVDAFDTYIDRHEYLLPGKRPTDVST